MDWKHIIEALKASGISQAEIARTVGVTPPVISDLIRGKQKDVGWRIGQKIIVLALQRECL